MDKWPPSAFVVVGEVVFSDSLAPTIIGMGHSLLVSPTQELQKPLGACLPINEGRRKSPGRTLAGNEWATESISIAEVQF